jgi:peptidoglycan/xylan/chitin deacetylase (PgdA/CDA1 family)
MRLVSLLFHDVYRDTPAESGFPTDAAHRYKLSTSAFDAQLTGIASAPESLPFAITVDDGGVSCYTEIADRLEARGWRSTCFVTTGMIGTRGFLDAAQIRALDARGHVIGTHSVTHPRRFSALGLDDMRLEWTRSRHTLEDILGKPVEIASVPGGFFSTAVARTAAECGIRMLYTSEPVTRVSHVDGCAIVGRFTIRAGDPPEAAQRFVLASGWARSRAWLDWNAKGLVKPVLGPAYIRFTDWLAAH